MQFDPGADTRARLHFENIPNLSFEIVIINAPEAAAMGEIIVTNTTLD